MKKYKSDKGDGDNDGKGQMDNKNKSTNVNESSPNGLSLINFKFNFNLIKIIYLFYSVMYDFVSTRIVASHLVSTVNIKRIFIVCER